MHPPPPAADVAMDFGQNSLFGYMEDLQELTIIERPVRRSLKTPEEIERLTVDEDLSDIDRAVFLLRYVSVFLSDCRSLPVGQTSTVSEMSCFNCRWCSDLLSHLNKEVLHVASVEMQLTAAVSFLTILQEESMSVHTYAHSFLQIILLNLEHRDTGVSNAWLETLLSAIELLPKETLRHEILNPLVSKAQLSQTVQSRLVSCKILGKLTNKFDAHSIKREILPLVKSLCQDVEYEVRSCMCRQLENIAQGIGTELTKSVVLPELIELSRDESGSVRLAAFETLVNMLDMFDTGIFTPDQHLRFLEFYKKLCTLGLQQENGHSENQIPSQIIEQEKKYTSVRKNCAYNFPAMIVFVDPKNFHMELYSTFFCLCHDPEVPVRYTIAICFYEVLDALINHLPEILELMSIGGESSIQENKLSSLPDLIPALTAAEQRAASSLKWRTHEKLLQKYACLPHIISSDQIYYRFLQRMFTIMMTNNVLPVQRAAARTLCVFLRYNRKQEQRHEVIQKLIELKSALKIPADMHLLQQLEMCVRKLLCQEKDKDVLAIVKKTVLELDRMEMSMDMVSTFYTYSKEILRVSKKLAQMINNAILNFKQFQKKNYEKDLLDQEKEREELLFLEMEQLEKEKHQNEGRSSSEKSFEKKRKEIKKSKLIRSQSFNNQAFHAKYGNLDKCASPVLPSTSRGTGNTADPKSSGSKDAQPRKATL
ncbi:Serine/threonine-protein phosphatase 4 regulatory subunit 4 [Microtus ochrogaster]|uniref:Serine/threonine-protein phosphatase 4 regulatory subunit 4 n=1 Tax=Microtus ochrogaster TaxID=79684 RepID=A0A8J6H1X4_MICOH|nr:Serine/threonine-protein phosphatase 4 regulatory subunit 4 [Microtus ochrogaster]